MRLNTLHRYSLVTAGDGARGARDPAGIWSGIGAPAWAGLAYVSVFSMLVWLRCSGIAGWRSAASPVVAQLQLLQPFFGLALARMLLGEPIAWQMIVVSGLVVLCVVGAKRFA